MLVNQVLADRVFIICGKTDMRKAINGLAEIVQNQYNLNPYESAAFLFCGRKADRMKHSTLSHMSGVDYIHLLTGCLPYMEYTE